jgi:prepilin-type N-terminal cleavage/methylation domain-containing protein
MRFRRVEGRPSAEDGFTIVEVVIAIAVLAMVSAPLAGAFWAAIRTAGVAIHRTDGSAISSREIESMRAVPYAQVGFYQDQPNYVSTYETFNTVTLGATAPVSGALVPQIQPQTTGIVQGAITFKVNRYVVWVDAKDASSTYTQAYKRLTVITSWKDQAGSFKARQDSLLYPGGQGQYQGAGATTVPTTTTTAVLNPSAPVLNAVTGLADPAGETQIPLTWSQPGGGAAVTSYTIQYSTSSSFPVGFSAISNLPPSTPSQTVPGLSANTTYYFKVIAYAGANLAASNVVSFATLPAPVVACNFGPLNVTGATSLSTTGTFLQGNGKMSEDLSLAWTTTGSCPHTYTVKATDPSNAADPGSPYSFVVSSGSYSASVNSSGSKSWGIGLHTFTVWDSSNNSATAVVKTFKVCANGSASC